MLYHFTGVGVVLGLISRCLATQFITKDALPSDNLTGDCVDALVAEISCPRQVMSFGTGSSVPDSSLGEACTASCSEALRKYEVDVAAACGESDVYHITESRTAPVSFLPTLLYYQFNKTCIEDNGQWYHNVAGNQTAWTDIESQDAGVDPCDDCVIKQYQFQAGSPINGGYALQPKYSSLTSSCSKTGFPLATSTAPFSSDPLPTTVPSPLP